LNDLRKISQISQRKFQRAFIYADYGGSFGVQVSSAAFLFCPKPFIFAVLRGVGEISNSDFSQRFLKFENKIAHNIK